MTAVLYPTWKLEYFREAGWEKSWIRDAKQLLHNEYTRKYVDFPIPEESESGKNHTNNCSTLDGDAATQKVCPMFPYPHTTLFIFACFPILTPPCSYSPVSLSSHHPVHICHRAATSSTTSPPFDTARLSHSLSHCPHVISLPPPCRLGISVHWWWDHCHQYPHLSCMAAGPGLPHHPQYVVVDLLGSDFAPAHHYSPFYRNGLSAQSI